MTGSNLNHGVGPCGLIETGAANGTVLLMLLILIQEAEV